MSDLQTAVGDSQAAYGDALMGTFLGNHDVVRWTTYDEFGWVDDCAIAEVSEDEEIYARLNLGWTFLFTQPGLPLIYYGDELGLPGNADPGNRQPLWWYVEEGMSFDSVDTLADALIYPQQEAVLRQVQALIQARLEHPALSEGETTEWWIEDEVWGYARVAEDDEMLVLLNRSQSDRSFENSLEFAGLTADATFEDVVTGETFEAVADSIRFSVEAGGSRVLVKR
jgi:glycosidase